MKQTSLTKAIDKAVELKLKAVDKLLEELVEPLADVGNPEQLIGKPYEDWSQQDLAMLTSIYGQKEPSLLSNLIFRKKYAEVKELEEAEL